MADEDNNKNEGKGFAGLSSLVSDIDVPAQPEPVKNAPPTQAQATADTPSPPPRRPPTAPSTGSPPTSGSSAGKWILGIAAVIGFFWLVGQSNKGPSSASPTYSPSAETRAPYTDPSLVAQPQLPSRPSEETPPSGQGHSLSIPQIRYCVAEDIRLDGARGAVNNYIDSHVDQFNAMVADYNSRCGEFRYRRGALESARQDIEPFRSALEAEGRSRFASARNTQNSRPPQSAQGRQPSIGTPALQAARPEPDSTVFAIQQKLNQLGYDAGAADGFAGNRTRSAIIAFQRDRGIFQDGIASVDLLNQLAKNQSSSSAPAPSTAAVPPEPVNKKPSVPDNAYVNGPNWFCKEGFRKVGERCEAVIAPQNAYISGPNWFCKEGFRKAGEQCEAVIAPQNAYISGPNWFCKDGFRKVGERCEAVIAPQNAYVSGPNWFCKDGYKKSGDKCVSIFE